MPNPTTKAIVSLEVATSRLLDADRADFPSLLAAMTDRSRAVEQLRGALRGAGPELSSGELRRIEKCEESVKQLQRRLLAERAAIRSELSRLSEKGHLLQALPQDKLAGLRIDSRG